MNLFLSFHDIRSVSVPPFQTSTDVAFYAAFGQDVTLNITVRAFPDITDLSSAFSWRRDGVALDAADVMSSKLSPEMFLSQLMINSVTNTDYKNYTVTVGNGIKEAVTFTLALLERGIPLLLLYHYKVIKHNFIA